MVQVARVGVRGWVHGQVGVERGREGVQLELQSGPTAPKRTVDGWPGWPIGDSPEPKSE